MNTDDTHSEVDRSAQKAPLGTVKVQHKFSCQKTLSQYGCICGADKRD